MVAVRRVHDLSAICTFDLRCEGHGDAHSVAVSDSGQHILVGMGDGQVLVITKPAFQLEIMRDRLQATIASLS